VAEIVTIEIIAETAQGFEGKPEQARLLVRAAAAAGADLVKFQLVYADELATPDYKYYDLFKSLEMADDVWSDLTAMGSTLGIQLSFDVFGARSLALSEKLGVGTVKLHGTDIANRGFLDLIARSAISRVLLGAGGAHQDELGTALEILSGKSVVVLLGFQSYPTPTETNHLARVRSLVERYGDRGPRLAVGFADHEAPESPLRYALAATALGFGATVIEKHLTLGRVMKLEDHESALNPDEFQEFCSVIRGCARAIGEVADQNDFGMSESEQGYRRMIRRHVVARRDLAAGTRLSPADLGLKRTSAEHVVTDVEAAYGKTLARDLRANAPVTPRDIA
jgi:sialic acid synthase SpsE